MALTNGVTDFLMSGCKLPRYWIILAADEHSSPGSSALSQCSLQGGPTLHHHGGHASSITYQRNAKRALAVLEKDSSFNNLLTAVSSPWILDSAYQNSTMEGSRGKPMQSSRWGPLSFCLSPLTYQGRWHGHLRELWDEPGSLLGTSSQAANSAVPLSLITHELSP